MRELYYDLINEKNQVENMIAKLKKSIERVKEGKINSSKSKKKYFQYYIVEKTLKGIEKRYAKKNEIEIVRRIAQRDYEEEILIMLKERLKAIDDLLNLVNDNNMDKIYDNLLESRKRLVNPIELPEDKYIEKWRNQFVLDGNSYTKPFNIVTDKGEFVRSKTEKIIADKLFRENIPYVYEPKVMLKNGRIFYADFAALNVRLRKTFYIEHFGMMDNPEYSVKAIEKIEEHQKDGMLCGKNILYTYETQNRMPDMKNLDNMINNYLK